MKRKMILLFLLALFGFTIRAQELTLETTAGNLHTLITKEQQKSVTSLTLKGSMDDSDFYFIRDEMPKVDYLDIEQIVDADTIPRKALYGHLFKVVKLPATVTYLSDLALYQTGADTIIISGAFPKLGAQVFPYLTYVKTLEDNPYCSMIDDHIYSNDGKVLYRFNTVYIYHSLIKFPDNLEIVSSRAFEGASFEELEFPASLKKIENYAFADIRIPMVASADYDQNFCLYFKSATPPVLEGNVFNVKLDFGSFDLYYICVPSGSGNKYRKADPQWSCFWKIEEQNYGGQSISSPSKHAISLVRSENGCNIKSETIITNVQVVKTSGETVISQRGNDTEMTIPLNMHSGVILINVSFGDGLSGVIKINL